ncbi:MAG: hypothetical protein RI926_680 [Actinomycetota bacterium]|jgi:thioredoxin 1
MASVELTSENFDTTIMENGIVVVDFWADWCGPCKMFAPTFEAASEKNPDIIFGKVDTEAQQSLSAAAGIQSIPTLMIFRDSILLFQQAGALPPAALEDLITQVKGLDMTEVHAEIAKQQAAAQA